MSSYGVCRQRQWGEPCAEVRERDDKIARLRAEVERLRKAEVFVQKSMVEKLIETLERERDEALAALKPKPDGGHSETMTWQEWAQHFQRERDEALAQVAALEQSVSLLQEANIRWSESALDERAEAVVEVLKKRLCVGCAAGSPRSLDGWGTMRHTEPLERDAGGDGVRRGVICKAALRLSEARALLDRLHRAEAVVDIAIRVKKGIKNLPDLYEALAAWEEGKA